VKNEKALRHARDGDELKELVGLADCLISPLKTVVISKIL